MERSINKIRWKLSFFFLSSNLENSYSTFGPKVTQKNVSIYLPVDAKGNTNGKWENKAFGVYNMSFPAKRYMQLDHKYPLPSEYPRFLRREVPEKFCGF